MTTAGVEFRAKALRLFAHVFDQFGAEDAVRKAGEILDHGGEAELPARLVAVDDQRLQIGARRVDGGGKAGATASDDDHVVHYDLPSN